MKRKRIKMLSYRFRVLLPIHLNLRLVLLGHLPLLKRLISCIKILLRNMLICSGLSSIRWRIGRKELIIFKKSFRRLLMRLLWRGVRKLLISFSSKGKGKWGLLLPLLSRNISVISSGHKLIGYTAALLINYCFL